jgi:hypothetical protein
VPLGGRTTATAVVFAMVTVCSFAMEATTVVEVAGRGRGSALFEIVSGLAMLGFLVTSLVAATLLGFWLHRAARNLRALGREGMQFSPALGLVSLYWPVVNLVAPIFALSELQRASDAGPQSDGRGWKTGPSGWALVTLWWTGWVGSSVAMWTSLGRFPRGAVPTSLLVSAPLASGLMAVACYASIRVMKSVEARQARAAARQS